MAGTMHQRTKSAKTIDPSGVGTTCWRRWLREPVVIFLLGGTLFSGSVALIAQWREHPSSAIDFGAPERERLSKLFEMQSGAEPTSAQLQAMVVGYIEAERLVREAYRLGLGRNDEIVRRRIIQKMRFLLGAASAEGAPTEQTLKAYSKANADRFRTPAVVSFNHIYFGSANAQDRANQLLREAGWQKKWKKHGDPLFAEP